MGTRSILSRLMRAARQPAVLMATPLAFLLGIAVMLPFGFSLDPNTATVIAATVTSLLAVGGALAVWHYQQDEEAKAVGLFIAELLTSATFAVELAGNAARKTSSVESWTRMMHHLDDAQRALTNVSSYYNRNNVILLKLEPAAISMLAFYFPDVLKLVNQEVGLARIQGVQAATKMYGGAVANAETLEFACKEYVQFCDEISRSLGISKALRVHSPAQRARRTHLLNKVEKASNKAPPGG